MVAMSRVIKTAEGPSKEHDSVRQTVGSRSSGFPGAVVRRSQGQFAEK